MYSLIFRNRWVAAAWALTIIASAYVVATRTDDLPDKTAPDANGTAMAFDEWASEDVTGDGRESEQSANRKAAADDVMSGQDSDLTP